MHPNCNCQVMCWKWPLILTPTIFYLFGKRYMPIYNQVNQWRDPCAVIHEWLEGINIFLYIHTNELMSWRSVLCASVVIHCVSDVLEVWNPYVKSLSMKHKLYQLSVPYIVWTPVILIRNWHRVQQPLPALGIMWQCVYRKNIFYFQLWRLSIANMSTFSPKHL